MMPRKLLVQALALLVLLATGAVLSAAWAQPPAGGYVPGYGMPPPMMGGMGGMHRNMMQRMMRGALPYGTDPALLPEPRSAGAHLLQQFCMQCHNLPDPRLHTASEWPGIVARMNMRMQMMGGMMHGMMGVVAPTGAELDALLAYLQHYAFKPIDPARYPDLDTTAGRAFGAFCAQCHSPPDPRLHPAQEWPAVVARMRGHMTDMGKAVPDETTTREILGFLEQKSHAQR